MSVGFVSFETADGEVSVRPSYIVAIDRGNEKTSWIWTTARCWMVLEPYDAVMAKITVAENGNGKNGKRPPGVPKSHDVKVFEWLDAAPPGTYRPGELCRARGINIKTLHRIFGRIGAEVRGKGHAARVYLVRP